MERRDALRLAAAGAAVAAAGPLAALLLRDGAPDDPPSGAPSPSPSPRPSPTSSTPTPPETPGPTEVASPTPTRAADYGPIGPVADEATGAELLWLPAGFTYRSLDWTGDPMSDGSPVPPAPDGMAAFPGRDGTIRLVRNHEVFARDWSGRVVGDPAVVHDPGAGGGTTTLELDAEGRLLASWASLGGTLGNCAGGPTPWGTWLSCEETTHGPDAIDPEGVSGRLRRPHGYLFEVPAVSDTMVPATPLRAAGRFRHEAVAWPGDGYLYLTEDDDAGPSGFYRYRPPLDPMTEGRLADAGTLEMLAAVDGPDLSGEVVPGRRFRVRWVPIDEPDPAPDGRRPLAEVEQAVVRQGLARGGTAFSRLEGCWTDGRRVLFASTQGGAPVTPAPRGFGAGRGQIWSLDLVAQLLTCVLAPATDDELANPDNLTISPAGGLVICEDRPVGQPQRLRGVAPDGHVFDLAQNAIPGHEGAELAGACFDPSGRILFVNVQGSLGRTAGGLAPGVTFAIRGPWEHGPL